MAIIQYQWSAPWRQGIFRSVEATRTSVSMLRNTFIHLPGIGPHRERAIWERGILDWEQFLAAAEKGSLPGRTFDSAVPAVCRSLEALASGDPGFFKPLLPPREAWRLYRPPARQATTSGIFRKKSNRTTKWFFASG